MSVILMKNKGFVAPDSLIVRALTDAPSTLSVALVDNNGVLHRSIRPNKADLDIVNSIQNKFKDNVLLMHFGKYPAGVNADDYQPMVLLKDGDAILSVAFLEGDYIPFKEAGSSHTPEFLGFHKLIKPLVERLYKGNNSDMSKFLSELRGDSLLKTQIENACVSRGLVSILANDGTVTSFHKDKPVVVDWGWYYGLTSESTTQEPPKEEPTAEPSLDDLIGSPAPAPVQQQKSKLIADTKSTEKKVEPTPTAVPQVPPKDAKVEAEFEIKLIHPPKELQSRNALKQWYRKNNHDNPGDLPDDWQKRPAMNVKIKKSKIIKDLSDLGNNVDKSKLKSSAAATVVVAQNNDTTEKTPVTTVPKASKLVANVKPTQPVQPDVTEEPEPSSDLPIIPPEQQEALLNDMTEGQLKKIIDGNGQKIMPPEEMKELEAKWPTFWEKTATHFEESAGWSPEFFMYLSKKYPEALAVLSMNFRTIAFNNANEIKKLRAAAEKAAASIMKPKSKLVA